MVQLRATGCSSASIGTRAQGICPRLTVGASTEDGGELFQIQTYSTQATGSHS